MYFINSGERVGQFLLFLKKENDLYSVLTVPDAEAIYVSQSEVDRYMENKLLEYAGKVPKKVANHAYKEWVYRKLDKAKPISSKVSEKVAIPAK